jgi:hypothetical protein
VEVMVFVSVFPRRFGVWRFGASDDVIDDVTRNVFFGCVSLLFFGGAYMFFGGAYDHYLGGAKKVFNENHQKRSKNIERQPNIPNGFPNITFIVNSLNKN